MAAMAIEACGPATAPDAVGQRRECALPDQKQSGTAVCCTRSRPAQGCARRMTQRQSSLQRLKQGKIEVREVSAKLTRSTMIAAAAEPKVKSGRLGP
jgi:hypothetical protein